MLVEFETDYARRASDDDMERLARIGGMYADLARDTDQPLERTLRNGTERSLVSRPRWLLLFAWGTLRTSRSKHHWGPYDSLAWMWITLRNQFSSDRHPGLFCVEMLPNMVKGQGR